MLEWTGERFLPWAEGAQMHYEHLHRYIFAASLVKGKRVLDLASGEGYGSYMLSREAKQVIGIEIDQQTVDHATRRYSSDNVGFICGSILDLPIEGQKTFDIVVCFEAIEHVKEHRKLLSEVIRVLKYDGLFIVSTPNKAIYTEDPQYQNPFHVKELYFNEFKNLLGNYFRNVRFLGQRVYAGSNIWDISGEECLSHREFAIEMGEKEFSFAGTDRKAALYFIALASDGDLEPHLYNVSSSLVDVSDTLLKEYQEHVNKLADHTQVLQSSLEEKTAETQMLRASVEEKTAETQVLQSSLDEKTAETQVLQSSLEEKDVLIKAMQASLEEKSAQIWALSSALASVNEGLIWRASMKFCSFIDRLLPLGTKRRYPYYLVIIASHIIVNEGWRSFWFKARRELWRKTTVRDVDPFQIWIAENEPSKRELASYRKESLSFPYRPKISIITPVWNPDKEWLRWAIESVRNQVYDNWELCIADGGSIKSEVIELLKKYAKKDSRIKVKFLPQNNGISGNSNEALSLATGEFVALLDHDDELAPFALYEVIRCLNENADLDFIYSDKDYISASGKRRFAPLFKPDWSPEMMLSQNYLTHLCVIRKSLIDEVGGFLPETDGAQDWDLFLRVTEKTQRIHHIPKILYHWRASDTSCASGGLEVKPYAFEAQRLTLENHLRRCGKSAQVIVAPTGGGRIKWLVTNKTKVSIIIPTKDKVQVLRRCVESVLDKTSYRNFELIIVDTGSEEATTLQYYDDVSKDPKVRIVNYPDETFNFSAANNLGTQHATGDALLFLNNDTEVINPDWLEEMVGWVEQKEIGVVGPKLLNPDDTTQHAGYVVGLGGFGAVLFDRAPEGYYGIFGSAEWYRNYLAVAGSCMMIRRGVFEEVGRFDEAFILCHSDIELCLRVRERGYRVVYVPYAKVKHHVSSTRGSYTPPEDWELWYKYCEPILRAGDPFFNPNLSYYSSIPNFRKKGEPSTIDFAEEWLQVEAQQPLLPLDSRFMSAFVRAESRRTGHGGDAFQI